MLSKKDKYTNDSCTLRELSLVLWRVLAFVPTFSYKVLLTPPLVFCPMSILK